MRSGLIIQSSCLILCGLYLNLSGAYAQEIKNIKIDKKKLITGEQSEIVVDFNFPNPSVRYCGIEIHFGDGNSREARVGLNGEQDFPFKLTYAYENQGTFNLRVIGKYVSRGFRSAGPCDGDPKEIQVTVADAAAENAKAELEKKQRELVEREAALRQEKQQLEREKAEIALEKRRKEVEARERQLAERERKLQAPVPSSSVPHPAPPPKNEAPVAPRRPIDAF